MSLFFMKRCKFQIILWLIDLSYDDFLAKECEFCNYRNLFCRKQYFKIGLIKSLQKKLDLLNITKTCLVTQLEIKKKM